MAISETTIPNNLWHKLKVWLAVMMLFVPITVYGLWEVRIRNGEPEQDSLSFYTAARMVLDGKAGQLYDYQQYMASQRTLVETAPPMPYIHPPFEVLAFLPLVGLPYRTAYYVMAGFNCVLFGVALWYLQAYLERFGTIERLISAGFLFWAVTSVLYGQDCILSLLFYAMTLSATRDKKEMRAGAYLALGLIRPQLVLPFLILPFMKRDVKFLRGFTLTAIGLLAASIAIVGWSGVWQYARVLLQLNGKKARIAYGVLADGMLSLRGLGYFLFERWLPERMIISVVLVASLCVLAWMARVARKGRRGDLLFAYILLGTGLVSWHMTISCVALLILPCMVLLNHASVLHGWRKLELEAPIAFLALGVLFVSPSRKFGALVPGILALAFALWSEIKEEYLASTRK